MGPLKSLVKKYRIYTLSVGEDGDFRTIPLVPLELELTLFYSILNTCRHAVDICDVPLQRENKKEVKGQHLCQSVI